MDDSKRVEKISLKRSILKKIVTLSVVYMSIALVIIGNMTFSEAMEQQDDLLLEISNLIKSNQISLGEKLKAIGIDQIEHDEAVFIYNLSQSNLLADYQSLASRTEGFYTLKLKNEEWRAYIGKNRAISFIVAQRTEPRNEYAWNSCMSFLLPTTILLLILVFAISYIVNEHFIPLESLGKEISSLKPMELERSHFKATFVEIAPFVNSINLLLKRLHDYISQQNLFIANASHELRTPVTALSLQIENLLESSNKEEYVMLQNSIKIGIIRLRKLTNQLLDLARLDTSNKQSGEKVLVMDIVKEVIEDLFPLIESKSLLLEVVHSDDSVVENIFSNLESVIRNAIENAIKFTPQNGKIDVSLENKSDMSIFMVENYDVSLSDDDMERISKPFFKIHENVEGSGLGLAICQKIAENVNGKLTLEKTEHGSFRFIFSFPLHLTV